MTGGALEIWARVLWNQLSEGQKPVIEFSRDTNGVVDRGEAHPEPGQ